MCLSKDSYPEYVKHSINQLKNRQSNRKKKWTKDLSMPFTQETIQ